MGGSGTEVKDSEGEERKEERVYKERERRRKRRKSEGKWNEGDKERKGLIMEREGV